jgi:dCTP deaminase
MEKKMGEALVQDSLPYIEDVPVRTGIYPAQWYAGAIRRGLIKSSNEISAAQIQPASIDLRLGRTAYRVPASFLPGKKSSVQAKLDWLTEEKIDLTSGAILQRGGVYIVPLMESLNLRKRVSAAANPKSSTGRLDVFARVITDFSTEFDVVAERYDGPLWVELAPRSFNVLVREGSRLVQMRIRHGAPRQSEKQLRRLHGEDGIVRGDEDPDIRAGGIAMSVDILGDDISKLIGYKAKKTTEHIDVDKVNFYDSSEYWQPVYRPDEGGIILNPDDFHILASKETVSVPPDWAADMIAYDTLVGEFRVHYAGFFDPGFGYSPNGHNAAKAVLEVRSHEVPFMIEDGQIVGRLMLERLTERTQSPYGSNIGSSYQFQGLVLSKQFRRS